MNAFDVVVIGSGCGGAPAAGNLAESGARVCVLERGTWWGELQGKEPYPHGYWGLASHLRGIGVSLPVFKKYLPLNLKAGLLEVYFVNGYTILIPCGVGGGSLVIGGFIDKPPRDIYDHYPPEITAEEMEPYFERVAEVVQPTYAPKKTWYMNAIETACDRIDGIRAVPQLTSMWYGESPDQDEERINAFGCRQKNCRYQADCLTGCNRSAKNSMDITYLQLVPKNGGQIRELSEVTGIRKTKGGYAVDYRNLKTGTHETVSAPKVIVSAGALNTMKILFASRANKASGLPRISERLGYRWGFNGDRIGIKLAWHSTLEHGHNPCLFRYHELAHDRHDFDFHQFACASSFMTWGPAPLRHVTGRVMPFLALSREEPVGRIWPAGEVVDIYYPSQDSHRRADISQRLIAMEVNAVNRPISEDKRQRRRERIERIRAWKGPGAVHQTGGAAMAEDIRHGVVDHTGEVFNYPGLFVSDASIFPIAPCCGPHFLIMAHGLRISTLLCEREK